MPALLRLVLPAWRKRKILTICYRIRSNQPCPPCITRVLAEFVPCASGNKKAGLRPALRLERGMPPLPLFTLSSSDYLNFHART